MNDTRREPDEQSLQLEGVGLTLLGIILSVGVTVALGVRAAWWVRALSGVGSVLVLLVFFGFVARPGRGPLSRLARWLTRA